MEKQKTISSEVRLVDKGLHTGKLCEIAFSQAPPNTGIIFFRKGADLPIEAHLKNVISVERGTTLSKNGYTVRTVEHLLAAIYALGIDNMYIYLDEEEVPAFDGSALKFVETLAPLIVEQNQPKNYITIVEPVIYRTTIDGRLTELIALPNDNLEIDCTIIFDHPMLKEQSFQITLTSESFIKELAPSKTFCFEEEIPKLLESGYGKGGDLENVIVIGKDRIYNESKMTFRDEFVRHKLVDFLGDLALIGKPVKAKFILLRCGHKHNIKFAEKIADSIKAIPKIHYPQELDINAIKEIIPHREPFLLVDSVTIIEEMKKARGYKFLTGQEDFFKGHFPGNPIMPGVLVVEALAQTACVLFLAKQELRDKLAYFMSIDETKFRKPVLPGDLLELNVEVVKAKERTGRVRGEAYVKGQLVAETEFMFILVEKKTIHPSAIIHPSAEIDENVEIGPGVIIGKNVKIKKGTSIGAYSNIEHAEINENCKIFPYTVIGLPPQDIRYKDEPTSVVIGPNTTIREFATIHRATKVENPTFIDEGCYLMAYTHIAHDCRLGKEVVAANCSTLAGHVIIEDYVTIGGLVAIHQFTQIGKLAMLGGGAMVSKHVPPFTLASGDRARLYGINVIGLRRRGFTSESISKLKYAFREVFLSKRPLKDSLEKLIQENISEEVNYFVNFLMKWKSSRRGVCRAVKVIRR